MLQERQGGTVTENKQKLIALVSVLEEENIIDYCYTFISLKVYGHAKLPDSITAELRQMWEEHMLRMERTKTEQTEEEKQAGEYRANIVRLLYGIDNVAILNYIRIIVDDIAKEPESGMQVSDERKEIIAELNKEVGSIRNISIMRLILNVVKSFKKNKKEIVSMLENVTDISSLQFIYGATKSTYREEQAERRIEDMEKRGVCDESNRHSKGNSRRFIK